MSTATFIVDAFTQSLFRGNQAAVCILTEDKSDQWLQNIAAEFNLSETAFLWHIDESHWRLRWFTPTCEVKLCGHATLAAAHVLSRELQYQYNEFIFSTLSGNLFARISEDSIALDFPRTALVKLNAAATAKITILAPDLMAAYQAGEDILLHLPSETAVQNYKPNFDAVAAATSRGLIITATADCYESKQTKIDFVSRFFAPSAGINEDPVTGSAHCALASLWSDILGKNNLRAKQLSQRTGFLDIVCHASRVDLIGNCVTFLRGNL